MRYLSLYLPPCFFCCLHSSSLPPPWDSSSFLQIHVSFSLFILKSYGFDYLFFFQSLSDCSAFILPQQRPIHNPLHPLSLYLSECQAYSSILCSFFPPLPPPPPVSLVMDIFLPSLCLAKWLTKALQLALQNTPRSKACPLWALLPSELPALVLKPKCSPLPSTGKGSDHIGQKLSFSSHRRRQIKSYSLACSFSCKCISCIQYGSC